MSQTPTEMTTNYSYNIELESSHCKSSLTIEKFIYLSIDQYIYIYIRKERNIYSYEKSCKVRRDLKEIFFGQ